ncbi:hypothetical protein PH547_25870 [Rhizobium sp. CNPSo 3464]|uniref:hypothetical protein n=1 Tax=Rhizobium sp. CNPSo 3464 TaxID=3021406 RepID=UPI00254BBAA9|nr:hypothetical protein [Rhizobium sp. CNPSo 3464]MDK4742321.1 hypothetical protein [Rhizobium sp. CNPSo 3464]
MIEPFIVAETHGDEYCLSGNIIVAAVKFQDGFDLHREMLVVCAVVVLWSLEHMRYNTLNPSQRRAKRM